MKKVIITRLVTEQVHTQGRIPKGTVGYRTKLTYKADDRWAEDKSHPLYKEYGPMIAVRFVSRQVEVGRDQFVHLWVPTNAYKEV